MDISLYNKIRGYLKNLIKGTPWEGKVYCVGGCCRDEVLGFAIKDVDLAVNVPNGGVLVAEWLHKKRLTTERPIYFHKFGTARLSLRFAPDDEIEVVQTRREQYTDRNTRNPETAFGTVYEDCERRDFTVNSLYYDISRGELLDLTGKALPDIERRILRTPMDPDSTFDDDPVRILRGVRFAARFGWPIESETYAAMGRNVKRLRIVSPERMCSELQRMVAGNNPRQALEMLRELGALEYILPEIMPSLNAPSPIENATLWEYSLRIVERIAPHDVELRMAALLQDSGMARTTKKGRDGKHNWPQHEQASIRIVKSVCRRLHFIRSSTRQILFLVSRHEDFRDAAADGSDFNDRRLRRLQYLCGTSEMFLRLMTLIDADRRAISGNDGDPLFPTVMTRSEKMVECHADMFGYKLPLTTEEISRAARLEPGPKLTSRINHLLRMAFANPSLTAAECLRELGATTPENVLVRGFIRHVEKEFGIRITLMERVNPKEDANGCDYGPESGTSELNAMRFIFIGRPERYFSILPQPDLLQVDSPQYAITAEGIDLKRILLDILDNKPIDLDLEDNRFIVYDSPKLRKRLNDFIAKSREGTDRISLATQMTEFLVCKSV